MLYPRRSTWDESDLRALASGEYDFQEFKASHFLDDDGSVSGSFLAAYSKQISAFANGAGGHLFIGIDDRGHIDQGVPVNLKNGGVRAWLEDITTSSVDPPLPKFNVYEVCSDEGRDTVLRPGKAVYVLEIPPSDAAPHQALDHRYYLRIAGKSRPMGHLHLQDILQRTRHPRLRLTRLGPFGSVDMDEHDPRGRRALLSFRAFLHNQGHNMARHVGGEIALPRPLVNYVCRERMMSYEAIRKTQRPGEWAFFKYHPTPLFPTQEAFFQRFWIVAHPGNLPLYVDGRARLSWKIYADDAPPEEGSESLMRFRVVRRAVKWVQGGRDDAAECRAVADPDIEGERSGDG